MATEEPVVETTDEKPKQEKDKQINVLGLTKKQRKRELKLIGLKRYAVTQNSFSQ